MSGENEPPPEGYRPNVGMVLFDAAGRVWLGRRSGQAGPHGWQFPQGGVDAGEDLEAAARRELHEETGVRSADMLARTPGWMTYDFPPELARSGAARGWRGQAPVWFAMRFTGLDAEIDLAAHDEIEFDAWRWAGLAEAIDMVVPFKRAVYARVAAAFADFASFAGGA